LVVSLSRIEEAARPPLAMPKAVALLLGASFGAATPAIAVSADDPADTERPAASASIWDGVYTESQAERGEYLYPGPCGRCHGVRLNGAPDDPDMLSTRPIAGAKFLRDWNGQSLATLFAYTRAAMPADNPRSFSDSEYADVIAYMLAMSGAPPGPDELRPDSRALARIEILEAVSEIAPSH
jgi:mono/diheme cytochrome c family protein